MAYATLQGVNLVLQELSVGATREDELTQAQFDEAAAFIDGLIDSTLQAVYVVPLNKVGNSYPAVLVGLANRLTAADLALNHFSQVQQGARQAAQEMWTRVWGEIEKLVSGSAGVFVIPGQRRHGLNKTTLIGVTPTPPPGGTPVPQGG